MASKYKGYLLKFGDVVLPNSYIAQNDNNTSIPNQREEIKAERDDYTRELMRVTADGMITKQTFVIRELTDTQMLAFKNVMKNSLVSEKQRKYHITYWNDENMQYEEGDFYIPDPTYTRKLATDTYIKYGTFEISIIGYATSRAV